MSAAAALADLFSEASPPPSPRAVALSPRPTTPSPPRKRQHQREGGSSNPLFLSPSDTPDRTNYHHAGPSKYPFSPSSQSGPNGYSSHQEDSLPNGQGHNSRGLDYNAHNDNGMHDNARDRLEEEEGDVRLGSRGSGGGGGGLRDRVMGNIGGYDPLDLSAVFAEQVGEGLNAGARGGAGDDEDGLGGGKKRRVMAKIDAERLMGEKGFPALMRSAKRFKPRGKGYEDGLIMLSTPAYIQHKDLKDILNVYQLWAHGMFPKGDFEGTIKRVETVCRTRRMELAMKGYKEAFYPPAPRSPSPAGPSPLHTSPPLPPSESAPISGAGVNDNNENNYDDDLDAVAQMDLDGGIYGGKRRSSEPLFDIADRDDEEREEMEGMDGPDFDELLAMEEMEREQAAAVAVTTAEAKAAAMAKGTGETTHGPTGEGENPSDRAGNTNREKEGNEADEGPIMLEEEGDEWEGLYA